MSPEERERMCELCGKLQVEQDHDRFSELMSELNNLLERKEHRLVERDKDKVNDIYINTTAPMRDEHNES